MPKSESTQNDIVIKVRDVCKSFRIYKDKSNTLKERLIFWKRGEYRSHKVLHDIQLDIYKGDTVALIGQNGSGKSTLLKLLTGIMYPDKGDITINGKVSSLLELGAGFHPDFTGHENIYNNASIFGLSKKEIDRRYEKIVAFSELEEYIHSPVRTYSSGMYMRLAFSVAINVDADILLIDEILAVGDASFQKKCMDAIKKMKKNGVTIVLVTHDMTAAERICDKAFWLENGTILRSGSPETIIPEYLFKMDEKSSLIAEHATEENAPVGSDDPLSSPENTENPPTDGLSAPSTESVTITDVLFLDKNKNRTSLIMTGEPMTIKIEYQANRFVPSAVFHLLLRNGSDEICLSTNNRIRRFPVANLREYSTGSLSFTLPHVELSKGQYYLKVTVTSEDGFPLCADTGKQHVFTISADHMDFGIYAPHMLIQSKEDKEERGNDDDEKR